MNNRSIRIFLSSTFRDFGEERDLLVRQVFPALRARLKDRFVEVVDVDLRWGITVEQAERRWRHRPGPRRDQTPGCDRGSLRQAGSRLRCLVPCDARPQEAGPRRAGVRLRRPL